MAAALGVRFSKSRESFATENSLYIQNLEFSPSREAVFWDETGSKTLDHYFAFSRRLI